MRGFTISARWPAISARRRRRMSSSLLPLNIGPQMTSSHPPRSGNKRIPAGTLTGRSDGLFRAVEGPAGEEAEADDPERAPVLDDREMAEIFREHDVRGFADRDTGLDRHGIRRHP